MMRSLYIIILFFPIVLYGQCLEGDCVNDWGIKQTETIKYVGTFSKGLFISGEVYYVEYNEAGENLYSKKERLKYKGEFRNGYIMSGKTYDKNEKLKYNGEYRNGNIVSGKTYDENEQLIYDGGYTIYDGYIVYHGQGISWKNEKLKFNGEYRNGHIVSGKTYDENEKLIYDGGYFTDDKYFYRNGHGILYEDGWEYKVKYNKNALIENTYSLDDISGSNMDYTIIELKQEELGRNLTFEININGKIQTYIFDTGAETFDISPSMEKHLIDTGIITHDNYYPSIETKGFNNEIEKSRRVWINNVRIGDYLIKNVLATINNDDDDPLLCGLALLELKFNAVSWNNDRSNDKSTLTLYK